MSESVIQVDHLAKRYVLGGSRGGGKGYRTLRESLVNSLRAPLARWRQRAKNGHATNGAEQEFWALKDVSFQVQPGEAVGIIGRNGAGKSTLLKVLSRITEPTGGRIAIRGRVASLLEVGTGFHPELTGRENIFLNGAILGMSRVEIKAKFDEIVAFAEVERFLDTPVKRYSSGMYVRLAFAVAAHLEPEILIVDEVLAVGDAEFQKKCLGKMKNISKLGGRTVLFVSHQMNAVEQMCSRVFLLDAGRLQTDTTDVRAAIGKYLAVEDGADHSLRARWTNSGTQFANPWFRPERIFVADEAGEPLTTPLPNDSAMWLQIEAEISELDPSLTVGYAIYSENNELLYWSYQTDAPSEQWPPLTVGKVILRGLIPPRFLNEGIYTIELVGGLHHREWLFEPRVNAPSIFLNLRGRLSDSPLWLEKRPGLLAPVLPWVRSS